MEQEKNMVRVYTFTPKEIEKILNLKGVVDRIEPIQEKDKIKFAVITVERLAT